MNGSLLLRLFLVVFLLVSFLYFFIEKQNKITKLRLEIPHLTSKLKMVEQENTRLQFELDQFEHPVRLMELAREPQYRHLKYPLLNEVITITVD